MTNKSSDNMIIFDGQVFQSTAWDRGMGKYSLNLLASLFKNSTFKKESRIVFAKNLQLSDEARTEILKACPGVHLDFLDLRVPKVVPGEDVTPLQESNKKILDRYIQELDAERPDYIILSLLIDQYVAVFPTHVRKILLFYDLIPLQYSDRYGQNWSYPNYLRRYKTIFEADTILTISQTVADDLAVYTGIDRDIIHSIDGGPIDRGHLEPSKPEIDLPKTFVLMPSGNDLRKNNFRAVQGFEEFRTASGVEDVKLVITSYFDEGTKSRLLELSGNLIFTGNVSEAELKWLYQETALLLFVSEYEGLGLPILEAAEVDKPIVCSNLTVFNEMSKEAFYYVDEHNPSSIASGMVRALRQEDFARKKNLYPKLLSDYTWSNTAKKALKALNEPNVETSTAPRQRLAIFTPSPSGYSAIGKVVMLSHHALSKYFDIDYFIEEGNSGNKFSRQSFLHAVAQVYPAESFTAKSYANYDAVIYHIGNSEYHLETIKRALYLPGYLIIHDTRLKEAFEDELIRYGHMDTGRLAAEQKLESLVGNNMAVYMTSLINNSLGAVVHSAYAKRAISKSYIGKDNHNIARLNLPAATPELKKLKIGDRVSVGFAGIIHKAKGLSIIDKLLDSPSFQNIDLYIFGVPLVEPGVLEKLESYPNIKIEKNLTDFEFESRLSEMDIIVSYRPSYNGETSLTVVEALRHGVVPLVRKVGWFDELPDDVVEKVASEDDVSDTILALLDDGDALDAKKRVAKKYAKDNHSYKQYAEGLYRLVNKKDGNTKKYKVSAALKSGESKDAILEIIANMGQ